MEIEDLNFIKTKFLTRMTRYSSGQANLVKPKKSNLIENNFFFSNYSLTIFYFFKIGYLAFLEKPKNQKDVGQSKLYSSRATNSKTTNCLPNSTKANINISTRKTDKE